MHLREAIDDRVLMGLLIPTFGLAIPHLTGLLDRLGPADAAWWWGHLWFVGGAAAIYGANRTLLFAGRRHADWFSRPLARLVLLASGVGFGTVPTTWVMLHFWSALAREPLGDAATQVMLINIICVLFVTWLYEMLFLIRERVDDQVRLTVAHAARTRAELDSLRVHVGPHFLFNALNTLVALVDTDAADAKRFVEDLARVYRQLLDTRGRLVVPLAEELELAQAYAALLEVRFGSAFRTHIDVPATADRLALPPGAVQVLLENALRHNAIDPDAPLHIEVTVKDAMLKVTHLRRPRSPNPGAGHGLDNLDARCRAVAGLGLHVEASERFEVSVPLVERVV